MPRLFRNRQQERAEQEALFIRQSAMMQRRMAKELRASYKAAAAALEQGGVFAMAPAIRSNSVSMANTLARSYIDIGTTFAKRLSGNMKAHYPTYRKDIFGLPFDERMMRFAMDWTATRITQIDQTTEAHVRRIVQNMLADGLSLQDAAKQISEVAGPMSATRAHIIARTEAHTAANAGQQFEAEASEFEMVKEWISSLDDRTRTDPPDQFDHKEPNGETASKDGRFNVGGELLLYPGDPAGSPGNVINCRCAIGWEIV